jgi:glycosyltransferase involved in cell wall biosynthesis
VRVLLVTNLYPSRERPDAGVFVVRHLEGLQELGIETELLYVDRAGRGRSVYRRLGVAVRQSVETNAPDLVHVMFGGVMADICTREIADRPVLVSFRGTDLLGGGARNLLERLSWSYGVLASRRAAVRAAGIVVMSSNLREALPNGVDPNRVWIQPNGVDLVAFAPRDQREAQDALGWDRRRKHVLFPSLATRSEKRFDLARAAVDLVSRNRSNVDLHVLSGVRHNDVALWLNAADVILLTSDHEGSPDAVKEALACNVPVVSVDVGDVRERIGSIDGCYVTDRRPASIALALDRVLARSARIRGREQMLDFSLERASARIAAIYRTLTGQEQRVVPVSQHESRETA